MTPTEYHDSMKVILRLSEILLQLPLDEILDLHFEMVKSDIPEGVDPEAFAAAKRVTKEDARLVKSMIFTANLRKFQRQHYPEDANTQNSLWAAKMVAQLAL